MKIALTGGIACGKSLLCRYLNELGVETLDADDLVHELIPEDERRRLAKVVFKDQCARKALEDKLHPIVLSRMLAWCDQTCSDGDPAVETSARIESTICSADWRVTGLPHFGQCAVATEPHSSRR